MIRGGAFYIKMDIVIVYFIVVSDTRINKLLWAVLFLIAYFQYIFSYLASIEGRKCMQ